MSDSLWPSGLKLWRHYQQTLRCYKQLAGLNSPDAKRKATMLYRITQIHRMMLMQSMLKMVKLMKKTTQTVSQTAIISLNLRKLGLLLVYARK